MIRATATGRIRVRRRSGLDRRQQRREQRCAALASAGSDLRYGTSATVTAHSKLLWAETVTLNLLTNQTSNVLRIPDGDPDVSHSLGKLPTPLMSICAVPSPTHLKYTAIRFECGLNGPILLIPRCDDKLPRIVSFVGASAATTTFFGAGVGVSDGLFVGSAPIDCEGDGEGSTGAVVQPLKMAAITTVTPTMLRRASCW